MRSEILTRSIFFLRATKIFFCLARSNVRVLLRTKKKSPSLIRDLLEHEFCRRPAGEEFYSRDRYLLSPSKKKRWIDLRTL